MRTSIALLVFNRPDTTARVFAEVAKAKPSKLLIIADGPRLDRPDDAGKCAAVRSIVERVDWDCEVLRNYSDMNLGCRRRVATGISWVFDQVDEAIILEDDCLPHPTFYRFCDELLLRYRDDERVMHISATNFKAYKRETDSYFFSCYPLTWGWATWRRAWEHFDVGVKLWPSLRETSWLQDIVEDHRAVAHWRGMLDRTYMGDIDTWDYQWVFACWWQNGLSILPNRNLLVNIGLGHPDATHTTEISDIRSFRRMEGMSFPLQHPSCVRNISEIDRLYNEHLLLPILEPPQSFRHRLRRKWSNILDEHPSLRSPGAFCQRLQQKFLSSIGLSSR